MPGRRRRRVRLLRRPPWRWSRRQQLAVGPPLGVAFVALVGLLLLLLTPIVGGGDAPSVPLPPEVVDNSSTPQPFRSPIVHPNPEALARARVLRVIDGDTIDVVLEGRRETVRYYGVDTPERNQLCYEEARAWNQSAVGEQVLLMADERERDRFGRLLRYVFTPDGQSLDAALTVAGVGVAWRKDGVYRDEIVALEQSVREEGVGCLWRDLADNDEDQGDD